MADFKAVLIGFHQNLNFLRKREAEYSSNAPLGRLDQIADQQTAIALTDASYASYILPFG